MILHEVEHHHRRGHAEGHKVGQRVQLGADFAVSLEPTGGRAVQKVKDGREAHENTGPLPSGQRANLLHAPERHDDSHAAADERQAGYGVGN